ncbi:MAG: hypothetical protein CAPSK01_002403 [Candidatus Accumulibacter vicinus]|uniref:Uncharacterized protein n=2 Tax=Candidatus Accumulibacter vicinus TaxID=2954382 RepID=A0A084XZC1_9PROT|nr:MAG: hypothetical protein CAPSK01_002403 [Candidatus Accumulibacter vicinus]
MHSQTYCHLSAPIMNKKLILPAEVKVCATCSYWDGERMVDTELRLVVVGEDGQGECLVQSKFSCGLNDVRRETASCAWEHLAPDTASVDLESDNGR